MKLKLVLGTCLRGWEASLGIMLIGTLWLRSNSHILLHFQPRLSGLVRALISCGQDTLILTHTKPLLQDISTFVLVVLKTVIWKQNLGPPYCNEPITMEGGNNTVQYFASRQYNRKSHLSRPLRSEKIYSREWKFWSFARESITSLENLQKHKTVRTK